MTYQQITREERYTIAAHRVQGLSVSRIAELTGRHRSSIYREIRRNCCHRTDGSYRPSKADDRARSRRSHSRRNLHYVEKDFKLVRQLLKKDYSPEQIAGFISRHKLMTRMISHETIYRYIWRDKANGGSLWRHLRQSSKQRRKRYNAYDSRGRVAKKRHISERHQSVETRLHKGHWEIDTVNGRGSKHCIVTLLERKTGYVLIGKMKDKTTAELNKRTIQLINRAAHDFKTITADNGTEFHQYKTIENRCDVTFYFATAYHSWERGSNENVNGLIRQYLPKNQSMEELTQQQCNAIADKLNTRPRKRHNYKTPEEMYYGI